MTDDVFEDSDLLGKLTRLLASDIKTFQHLFDGLIGTGEHRGLNSFIGCSSSEHHDVRLILILRRLNRIAL